MTSFLDNLGHFELLESKAKIAYRDAIKKDINFRIMGGVMIIYPLLTRDG